MPRLGFLYTCSHCGVKEFFQGSNGADNAENAGWKTVGTPTENLELCKECYNDYLGMIRAFKLGTAYRMPSRDKQNQFIIHNEECDNNNGSKQPAQEQYALEPADTSADSADRAKAICEAGGDRCQGR